MKTKMKIVSALLALTLIGTAAPVSAANTGWNRDATGWWYQNASGSYERSGWSRIDEKWYYFSDSGYMRTGWVRDNGKWYFLDGSGAMRTGWLRNGGKWYFLDGSGAMKTGWVYTGGKWYYLDESGAMLSDTLLELSTGSYYLGSTGAMFIGTMTLGGRTMIFGSDGALLPDSTGSGSDTLVVYFSASGHTERVAKAIADATGGDLFELVPENPYTSADLNYTDSTSRVVREYENESLRDIPLVSTTPENWEDYDTVFVGYPIWWGIAAWPTDTFAKENDFTGKTVIPFATSVSSGMGQSGSRLAAMAGTGDWKEGHRFSSGASDSDVKAWVDSLY